MRNKRYALLICLLITAFFNFGFSFGSSPESIVKKSPAFPNSKVEIGPMLENYKYVKDWKWRTKKEDGKVYVEFRGQYTGEGACLSLLERYYDKSKMDVPIITDIFDNLPEKFWIVGLFEVADGRVVQSKYHLEDPVESTNSTSSIPPFAFIEQRAIPDPSTKFFYRYYNYHLMKYFLQQSVLGKSFYNLSIRDRDITYDLLNRLKVVKLEFDDAEQIYLLSVELEIFDTLIDQKLRYEISDSNDELNMLESFSNTSKVLQT